jgi:ankyrin repeat protein
MYGLPYNPVVELLIENGANLNEVDKNGQTPLHLGIIICLRFFRK